MQIYYRFVIFFYCENIFKCVICRVITALKKQTRMKNNNTTHYNKIKVDVLDDKIILIKNIIILSSYLLILAIIGFAIQVV